MAPDRHRQSTWKTFLEARWEVLASVDFTMIAVWTRSGLVTCHLLFVMELATRRVLFGGCTPNPDESWMCRAARNLRKKPGRKKPVKKSGHPSSIIPPGP